MDKVLVLHGPNLNRLGSREPGIYGKQTLQDLNSHLQQLGERWGIQVDSFQSNVEGVLIDQIHQAEGKYSYIIMNPGAYTHYSYAIRDAIASIDVPVYEVHISHIHTRETFRHTSVIAPVCKGQITGYGTMSYELALYAIAQLCEKE